MIETLRLEIVTPQSTVSYDDVQLVTLPAIDGQIGIYPQHVSLITQIVPGEIVLDRDGHQTHLAVGEGLVEVSAHYIAIVTDMVIEAEQIAEARIEEARQRAAARRSEKISDEEVASVNASLARSLAHLQIKRRRRS